MDDRTRKIVELYNSGLTLNEVAAEMSMPWHEVRNAMIAAGAPRRKTRGKTSHDQNKIKSKSRSARAREYNYGWTELALNSAVHRVSNDRAPAKSSIGAEQLDYVRDALERDRALLLASFQQRRNVSERSLSQAPGEIQKQEEASSPANVEQTAALLVEHSTSEGN